jgi:hypothetical protein
MEKSVWVKLVWLGSVLAIPAALLAVQKPQAVRVAEVRRVMAVDAPVAVDIGDRQIESAKPAESAPVVEPPKPHAVRLGADRINSKAPSPPDSVTAKPEGAQEANAAAVLPPTDPPHAAR